jgi:hypothetical protein
MELLDIKRVTMGVLSGYSYLTDPKLVSFVTSWFKFTSKIFDGYSKVKELVSQTVFIPLRLWRQ